MHLQGNGNPEKQLVVLKKTSQERKRKKKKKLVGRRTGITSKMNWIWHWKDEHPSRKANEFGGVATQFRDRESKWWPQFRQAFETAANNCLSSVYLFFPAVKAWLQRETKRGRVSMLQDFLFQSVNPWFPKQSRKKDSFLLFHAGTGIQVSCQELTFTGIGSFGCKFESISDFIQILFFISCMCFHCEVWCCLLSPDTIHCWGRRSVFVPNIEMNSRVKDNRKMKEIKVEASGFLELVLYERCVIRTRILK